RISSWASSYFFFSSRRRHTRFSRDWSSDVCSSDLKDPVELHGEQITRGVSELVYTLRDPLPTDRLAILPVSLKLPAGSAGEPVRSEERRVGREGGSRWSPQQDQTTQSASADRHRSE